MHCRIIIIKSLKRGLNYNIELIHLQFKEIRMRSLIFLLFLGLFHNVNGQDTLLLMNGKQFVGSAIDTSDIQIKFNLDKKAGKVKLKKFYRDQVFSIRYANANEKIFFYPEIYYVDDYTVENMRAVVCGKKDARYGFKTKWILPVGFAACAASTILMKNSVFVLLLPVVYTGIVQIPIVKIQKPSITNETFIGNEFYKEGYNKSARSKRTRHALISGVVGVLTGILVYEAIK